MAEKENYTAQQAAMTIAQNRIEKTKKERQTNIVAFHYYFYFCSAKEFSIVPIIIKFLPSVK